MAAYFASHWISWTPYKKTQHDISPPVDVLDTVISPSSTLETSKASYRVSEGPPMEAISWTACYLCCLEPTSINMHYISRGRVSSVGKASLIKDL